MEQPLRGGTTEGPVAQGPRRQTLPSLGSGPGNVATPGTQPAQLSLNSPQRWALEQVQSPTCQYSSLENSMDVGTWWATVLWVTESDTTEYARVRIHACTHAIE